MKIYGCSHCGNEYDDRDAPAHCRRIQASTRKAKKVRELLYEALECLEHGSPPSGGRTDKLCRRIKRVLPEYEYRPLKYAKGTK